MSLARLTVTRSGTSPRRTWPSASRRRLRSGSLPFSGAALLPRYSEALISSARSIAIDFARVPGDLPSSVVDAPLPTVAAIMAVGTMTAASTSLPRVLAIMV